MQREEHKPQIAALFAEAHNADTVEMWSEATRWSGTNLPADEEIRYDRVRGHGGAQGTERKSPESLEIVCDNGRPNVEARRAIKRRRET